MIKRDRFQLIDGVRGIAILWIVVFHLLNEHVKSYPPLLSTVIKSGHLGVPIFFTVSGFSVSAAAARVLEGKVTPLEFLNRRLVRIYKPLFFSLITAALVIPWLCAVVCAKFGFDSSEYFFHYSIPEWIGLFTLTKIFVPAAGDLNRSFLPINGALWFIAVLVQMYVVVYAALLRPKLYSKILLAITGLWILTLFPGFGKWVPRGFFIGSWGGFAAGMALYFFRGKGSEVLRLILFAVSLVSALKFPGDLPFTVCFVCFLWLVYPYDSKIASWRIFSALTFLGGFSYSLYLLHIPLDNLVSLIAGIYSPFPASWTDLFLIIPVIVFLSWVWSLFFEREFPKGKQILKL